MTIETINTVFKFFTKFFSLERMEKPTKFFHVDRKLRSVIYFLTGKINKDYKLHKVLVMFDESSAGENQANLIVIISGTPKRIFLDVESQINEIVKDTAELHNVKMSVMTIFQAEYENPFIYTLPGLIRKIKQEGVEVCSFNT